MGVFKNVGTGIIKSVIIPAGNAISNVIKKGSGTSTYENTFATSKAGQAYTKLLGATAIATAIAAPTSALKGKTTTISGAVLKKSAISTASLITIGSAASSTKVAETITKSVVSAPSNLSQFGSNVGNVIEDPSVNSLTKVFKDNPVISTGAALGIAGGAALGVGSIITNIENKQATRENTKAIENLSVSNPVITNGGSTAPQGITIINQLPPTVAPIAAPTSPTTTALSSPISSSAPIKKTKRKASKKKKSKKKKKKSSKKKKHKYKSRKKVNGRWVYKY